MKQSLYLETSVVGAYLDNGEPFRRDLTIRWWEHEMPEYRAVISPLVLRELERVTEPHRTGYLKLAGQLEQVELTDEAAILAEGYISRGIFHRKFIADAVHVALASFHKIDYLVTWNFGHLANVRRQARIRLFNTAAGFFVPQIVTPAVLSSLITHHLSLLLSCTADRDSSKSCTPSARRCRARPTTTWSCSPRWCAPARRRSTARRVTSAASAPAPRAPKSA